MLLLQAERRLALAERLVVVIADERDASRVTHRLTEILRARLFAIACGYEDADDLDRRCDAAFKLAAGGSPTAEPICACSPPSRAGRTRRRCVTPSA